MDDAERLKIALTNIDILSVIDNNYASKLAKDLCKHRKTVHRHLKILEDAGLIEGTYIQQNQVIRKYNLTSKGKEIMKHVRRVGK